MSDHMKLWQSVEKTPPEHTKAITGKAYSGTSPKPFYLIKKATETFGPCGIGWGFSIVDERIEEGTDGEKLSIARVRVWYEWAGKRGEVEHIGGTPFSGKRASGKPFIDEDAPKKSVTDALVKALSMIGFGGDIFIGRYDDSKYVSGLKAEAAKEEASKAADQQPAQDNASRTQQQDGKSAFWKRASLTLKASGPEAFATSFCNALYAAPSYEDHLRLIKDNITHVESLPDIDKKRVNEAINKRAGFWAQAPIDDQRAA